MALSFEQALPGLQAAGHANIMDALAAYNQAQQQATFAPTVAAPAAEAPQTFLNLTAPATTPAPTGIAALPAAPAYDPTKLTSLESLYQYALGRPADVSGKQYWGGIESGGITPEEYQRFLQVAEPERRVQQAFQSVLGRQADIPGLEYYTPLVQAGTLAPEKLQSTLAYGARSLADQLAAQKFLGQEVFGKPEDLRSKFTTEYGKTLEDVIGKAEEITGLEKLLGVKEGALTSAFAPTRYEQAGSIEDIRKKLEQSPVNKAQEAARTAAVFKNLYGLTDEQVKDYTSSLYSGKGIDSLAEQYYKESLTGNPSLETQQKLIQDAAKKNPESDFFKKNARALVEATPIGEMKRGEETSNTYGVDPLTNLPILHKEAFNKALGKEVILSGPEDFTNFTKQQWIGADPHSRYGGMLAKGVGIFGVKADQEEVTDFDKIEKQLAKLGGVQRMQDPEGGIYEYVDIPTEGGEPRRVRIEDLFDTGGEFGYNGADRYRLYQDTKQKLGNIAAEAKVDPTKYGSTKELYDALNDRLKNTYVWQGRTDTLDPAAAKALGIEDTTDNRKHATILYRDAGDKLIPEKVIKTFDYQDPNTSRGFIGDTLGSIMEILSVPPIALALGMAGGLPSLLSGNLMTGLGYGAFSPEFASAMSSSIFNPASVGASLGPTLGITDPAAQKLLGTAVVNAGLSGLSTGAATGDLSQAGLAALAGGAGTATQGLTADLLGPTASRMAGSAVSGAIQGKDLTDVLLNQALSSGLGQLLSSDKTGSTNVLAALAPAILTGNISPTDIMRLSQALESERKQGR